MKKNYLFSLAMFVIVMCGFVSCSDDENSPEPQEPIENQTSDNPKSPNYHFVDVKLGQISFGNTHFAGYTGKINRVDEESMVIEVFVNSKNGKDEEKLFTISFNYFNSPKELYGNQYFKDGKLFHFMDKAHQNGVKDIVYYDINNNGNIYHLIYPTKEQVYTDKTFGLRLIEAKNDKFEFQLIANMKDANGNIVKLEGWFNVIL